MKNVKFSAVVIKSVHQYHQCETLVAPIQKPVIQTTQPPASKTINASKPPLPPKPKVVFSEPKSQISEASRQPPSSGESGPKAENEFDSQTISENVERIYTNPKLMAYNGDGYETIFRSAPKNTQAFWSNYLVKKLVMGSRVTSMVMCVHCFKIILIKDLDYGLEDEVNKHLVVHAKQVCADVIDSLFSSF